MGPQKSLNLTIGGGVSWLNLVMVLLTLAIVVFRYAFQMSWVWLQELVICLHASVFMLSGAYTLARDQHVRVDIFYSRWTPKIQRRLQKFGILVFLFPFCAVMLYFSGPYVLQSWKVYESSGDANGLPGVFLLKSLLIAYPVLLVFEGFRILGEKNEVSGG